MHYIALQMLFGNKAKYFTMVIGISFAALIMTQQPAIFIGLLSRTYSFVDNIPQPDIWVMDPGVQYAEKSRPIRDIELLRVRGVSGIDWAVPIYKRNLDAKLPDGQIKGVDVTGIDSASLIGIPGRIIEGSIDDFRRPDTIFVDVNAANSRFRVKINKTETRPLMIGDTLEIEDRRALVVGMVKVERNFILTPQIYTSYTNASEFTYKSGKNLAYVLVKAKEGVDHIELAKRISDRTGLAALTSDQFRKVNLDYWMNNTGIAINFGVSVLLGFLVGAAIAGQTFYGFIIENIQHYAVLKAMGITTSKLIQVVLLQAVTVGLIGYGIGVGLTAIFGLNFLDAVLAFRMPPELLLFAAIGVIIIISLSALLAIRKIIKVDPASVFRG